MVLASDKDIEFALRGLFGRYQALEIRPVDFEVVVHPNRDPGCYHTSHELLAPYAGECDHALVVFDRAWEGAPSNSPAELARHVEEQLQGVWGDRGRSIVIDPEVEVWVWSDSPHVASALGWDDRIPNLRAWLDQAGLWPFAQRKPPDPKVAFLSALRQAKLPPSAAIFRRLADTVSLHRCEDPSFRALRDLLRFWFATAERS